MEEEMEVEEMEEDETCTADGKDTEVKVSNTREQLLHDAAGCRRIDFNESESDFDGSESESDNSESESDKSDRATLRPIGYELTHWNIARLTGQAPARPETPVFNPDEHVHTYTPSRTLWLQAVDSLDLYDKTKEPKETPARIDSDTESESDDDIPLVYPVKCLSYKELRAAGECSLDPRLRQAAASKDFNSLRLAFCSRS